MSIVEKIQYQDDFLSEENIDSNINILWGKMLPILQHRRYLYDRYTRKYDTNDVVVALEYYISIMASGYFGGKEPQFKVKRQNERRKKILQKIFDKIFGDKNNEEEYQAIIDYITTYNDNGSFFYDLVKDYINTGACYGLLYENKDNEIVYAHTSSLTTVAIYNYETPNQIIGLLRCWYENSSDGGIKTNLEIITDTYKKHYIDGISKKKVVENAEYDFKEVEVDKKEVLWKNVPCLAVENPDGLGFFENVITLIRKHEQIIRNNANIFQYNDEAKLKITGYTPEHELLIEKTDENGKIEQDSSGNPIMIRNPKRVKEDEATLKSKVFYTPDNSGDIGWVIKDINDTASENHKKTTLDELLMISGVPNVTDQGFTNADNASALEKKFFPLEQVLQQADNLFRKEFLRMWEMITSRINIKKTKEFDFRDIEIILVRNLPNDTSNTIDTWLKLRGLLSDKTIIEHLPYDLDSESELAELDNQNERNIEKDIAQIKKNGQTDNNEKYEIEDLANTQKESKIEVNDTKKQQEKIKKKIEK